MGRHSRAARAYALAGGHRWRRLGYPGPSPENGDRVAPGWTRREPRLVGADGRRRSLGCAPLLRACRRALVPPGRSRARSVGRFVSGERRARVDTNRRYRPSSRRRTSVGCTSVVMLNALRVPLSWRELAKRTYREVLADNCLGLAAQLAYYFFLALFPALLFVVAIISFVPVEGLLDSITNMLARVAPYEMLKLVQDQILKIANDKSGGLLTLGMIGTIWSTSSGVTAIIDTLNQAYDVQEARPWWKVQLIALGLTMALAAFIVISFALVLVGPSVAESLAARFYLGAVFEWTSKILQWPIIFALVSLAIA